MPRSPKPHACGMQSLSLLAALIVACRDEPGTLPVLADWLEDRGNLPAIAALLRLPGLEHFPEKWAPRGVGLLHAPLAGDALVWLVRLQLPLAPGRDSPKAGIVVGLYAHPSRRPDAWARIPRRLMLEPGMEARVEAALAEIQAIAGLHGQKPS